MKDGLVSATRAYESVIPCDATYAALMSLKCLDNLLFGSVPNLQISRVSSHSEQ